MKISLRDEAAMAVQLIGISSIIGCVIAEAAFGGNLLVVGYLAGCLIVTLGSLIYKKRLK